VCEQAVDDAMDIVFLDAVGRMRDGLIESVELLGLEIRKRVLAEFKLPAVLTERTR
jgi:hypothetical protein